MIRVSVTKDHIKQGNACSPWHCPVALAIRERLGLYEKDEFGTIDPHAVAVTADYASVGGRRYTLSKRVGELIDRFDAGKRIKPFTFNLPIKLPRKKAKTGGKR